MHKHKVTATNRSALNCAARVFLLFAISSLWMAGGIKNPVCAMEPPKESVNPHFTGKNCLECHTEEQPKGTRAPLKFNGDPVKLCTRCHMAGLTCNKVHPVGVGPTDEMRKQFPQNWPLDNGKINCLTCHDVHLQMTANIPGKQTNAKFIRGAPYETLTDFCFICHKEEQYKKTNPHLQLDEKGKIIESTCLFCHETVPDSARAQNMGDVTFKSELSSYCINCHAKQKTAHPANADHLRKVSDSIKASLTKLPAEQGADFPLDGDIIFCATCHNPHQKGVLQKKEAQRGAGEKYFVRLNRGYDLCVACHSDKRLETAGEVFNKPFTPSVTRIVSTHKPVAENKCKMCHAVKASSRDKPSAMALCFREGCHKTELIQQPYTHDKAVLEKCYYCHKAHASTYMGLLTNSPERLCRGCHPQLRDKKDRDFNDEKNVATVIGQAVASQASSTNASITSTTTAVLENKQQPKDSKDNKTIAQAGSKKDPHVKFIRFLAKSTLPRESRCGFCHNPNHRREIVRTDITVCSECHIYVQGILSKAAGHPVNKHQKFTTTRCSDCHDPHSSMYAHLLKLDQPIEYYYKRDVSVTDKTGLPSTVNKTAPPPSPKP